MVEYYFFKLLLSQFNYLIYLFVNYFIFVTQLNAVRKTGEIKLKQFLALSSNYFIYICSLDCKLKSWLLIWFNVEGSFENKLGGNIYEIFSTLFPNIFHFKRFPETFVSAQVIRANV